MSEIESPFHLKFKPLGLDYQYDIEVSGNSETHSLPKDFFQRDLSIRSAFDCAVNAAQRLADINYAPVLCLSGGLDSQAMLSVFREAGVSFKACFFRFNENLNGHELASLIDYCDAFGIKAEVMDFDILDFFDSGKFFEVAVAAKTNSPLFAAHAWMAEKIDGFPVFAGQAWSVQKQDGLMLNEITPEVFEKNIIYVPSLKEYAASHYLGRAGRECVPHFFQIEKELVRAFWRNRYWLNYANMSFYNSVYDYQHKYFAYLSSGFPLIAPSRLAKLTGFERVHFYYQKKYNSTDQYYFNELFRRPLERLIPVRTELHLKLLS